MPLPAFDRLVDLHGAEVHRAITRRIGAQDADDVWQETFLAALRAYPALRADSNLRGWLHAIAERKGIDLLRRRGRAAVPAGDGLPEEGTEDVPPADWILWRRVVGLPPRQRVAVALRYACDLTYADIAALDGGTEEAARRNVHAGLATLRKETT